MGLGSENKRIVTRICRRRENKAKVTFGPKWPAGCFRGCSDPRRPCSVSWTRRDARLSVSLCRADPLCNEDTHACGCTRARVCVCAHVCVSVHVCVHLCTRRRGGGTDRAPRDTHFTITPRVPLRERWYWSNHPHTEEAPASEAVP